MKGARVGLLVWPEASEGVSLARWRRALGSAGEARWVEGGLREAAQGAAQDGFDVIGVVGDVGQVAEVGAVLAQRGSEARLLAVPSASAQAITAELGMQGEGVEVVERLAAVAARGVGLMRRAPGHAARRLLRVSMSDQPGARYGFTLGMGSWTSWSEGLRLEGGSVARLARAVAGEVLRRGGGEDGGAGRLVVDGAPVSDVLRLTVMTTLRRLGPGVTPFAAIEAEERFNVLHGDVGALVSAGAVAMLTAGRRSLGGAQLLQARRAEVVLEGEVMLDGRRFAGGASRSVAVRPGPLLSFLVP